MISLTALILAVVSHHNTTNGETMFRTMRLAGVILGVSMIFPAVVSAQEALPKTASASGLDMFQRGAKVGTASIRLSNGKLTMNFDRTNGWVGTGNFECGATTCRGVSYKGKNRNTGAENSGVPCELTPVMTGNRITSLIYGTCAGG
jgi:hypothetical protein